jgi:hypothetical protein
MFKTITFKTTATRMWQSMPEMGEVRVSVQHGPMIVRDAVVRDFPSK